MMRRCSIAARLALVVSIATTAAAQVCCDLCDSDEPVKAPRIFLDKSLRIVQYQLRRLDNERLLLVERKTDDPKYAPVFTAILVRDGMSPQYREEALQGLMTLNESTAVKVLLDALETVDGESRQQRRTGRQLASMLLRRSPEELDQYIFALGDAIESDNGLLRAIGHAGLVLAGAPEIAWSKASGSKSSTLDWLAAVDLLPRAEQRSGQREQIVGLVDASHPVSVRRAAIEALAVVPAKQPETFQLIAPHVKSDKLRAATVSTLLAIPAKHRDVEVSRELVEFLVEYAEATPPADRTTDEFLDAMQLADQLLARLPVEQARSYRDRLREITVRVVRVRTVEEEMRYDLPYFAVEAGRPVQVVLQNEDLMPHNLVVTLPGTLQEVAEQGLAVGPTGTGGKPYVPANDKVLFATRMVQPYQHERLTFTAPTEPGEYPYVCTFPRHWMRMYGVMIVVEDLDAWQQNPTVPKDPVGSNRAFVKSWQLDDFTADLDEGFRGRSAEIGQRLFKEATCAQCHKVAGKGGAVGPELTDVFKRWKGDRAAVLREVLEPSHRIDPKYAVHVIYTVDGKVVTGIVTTEDKKSVSVLDNPESPKPTVIAKDDIDEMVKTSKSMMPKALLDRFTKDEIFELVAYLESVGPSASGGE